MLSTQLYLFLIKPKALKCFKIYPLFLKDRINRFYNEKVKSRKNGKPLILGKNPNQDSILLTNNDYLSLVGNSKIISSQIKALKNSTSLLMSASYMQGDNPKREFEKTFADFIDFEDSILCQSGWAANVGLIQSITDKETPVYIDFTAHVSLWEGIKSSQAKAKPFLHNNLKHLEKLIKRNGQGVIIVDSVYSVNGSICPLKEVVELAEKYNCVLVVDESHSLGVYGKKGQGLVADLGLNNKVHFITVSLAKSFAGRAGIIGCSKEFAGYFPFVSFPAIFSSTLLDHEIAAFSATLEVIKKADDKRKKLHGNADYLRNGLIELGYKIASKSQIIALETGTDYQTEIIRDELENRNIFGSVFCYPAAPKNKAVIRFSINSNLTKQQLDCILRACKEIKKS